VRDLVVDDDVSRTRYSRHVSVCLIDLKTGEIFYDDSDATITENIGIFKRAVQTEEIEDCVSMLHSEYVTELGRETVMAEEVAEKTDYNQNVIKQSFEQLNHVAMGTSSILKNMVLHLTLDELVIFTNRQDVAAPGLMRNQQTSLRSFRLS